MTAFASRKTWELLSTGSTSLVVILCVVSAVGCGDSKFEFAPVSGQVTLDGEPVPGATVVFMPSSSSDDAEAGPYSNGETDEQGRFELKTIEERPSRGAVVGRHRIMVSTKQAHLDPNDPDVEIVDVEESIPLPYHDYRRTPLEFEVTANGSDSANFVLESRRRRR